MRSESVNGVEDAKGVRGAKGVKGAQHVEQCSLAEGVKGEKV